MKRNQRYDPDRVHELEKIARMFIDDTGYLWFDEWGAAYACLYCDGEGGDPFEHTPECLILAGRDLLTGIEEKQG